MIIKYYAFFCIVYSRINTQQGNIRSSVTQSFVLVRSLGRRYQYIENMSAYGVQILLYKINESLNDGRVVRSLDPSKGSWFQTTFRPFTTYEERISQLSVILGKKAKGITRCGHIERKDRVSLLD